MNRHNVMYLVALCLAISIASNSIAVETENGIDSEFYVTSGEAELYIKVRGQDINNPVLLYLHGGPGEANGPLLFQAYAGPELEKHYVVGYLHQRNTCLSPDAPAKTITVGQFIKDVDAVVAFLQKRFEKDKVFLLGHSFGGSLGLLYLLEHGDNIEKFVCAAGAFSLTAIQNTGYQTVMEMAKIADNQQAIEQLENVGPPPYDTFREGIVWRRLAMELLEEKNEGFTKNLEMSKVISNTGIKSVDPDWQRKSMIVVNTMWKELSTIEIEDKVHCIGTPMLLITGAKDILVPFRILEKGYKNYGGEKEHFNLENSNHFMFIDEPGLFVSKVIKYFKS